MKWDHIVIEINNNTLTEQMQLDMELMLKKAKNSQAM